MTRHWFGRGLADWTFGVGSSGQVQVSAGAALTFWNAPSGGAQYRDLLDDYGQPITSVVSGTGATIPAGAIPRLQGPDGITEMWVAAGVGARALMTATDAGATVATLTATLQAYGDMTGALAPATPTPQMPLPTKVLTLMQPSHGWTGSGDGVFDLADATDAEVGVQAARMTSGGIGSESCLRRFGRVIPDVTGKLFRLRLKIEKLADLRTLTFAVGRADLSHCYRWTLAEQGDAPYLPPGEWAVITLSLADAQVIGSPDFATITDLQLQVVDTGAGRITVRLQSVELIPTGLAMGLHGLCSITFDDSLSSPKDNGAWAALDAHGLPATLYTVTEALGAPGRLSADDLKARQRRFGWEIGGQAHTLTAREATPTGMTEALLAADHRAQKGWMLANGFRGDSTAYPAGQFGTTIDKRSTGDTTCQYWASARTLHGRTLETWPPAAPDRLRAVSGISGAAGGITASDLIGSTGKIRQAVAGSGWLILVFRSITKGPAVSPDECSIADFAIIAEAVASAMEVRTVGDVLRLGSAAV